MPGWPPHASKSGVSLFQLSCTGTVTTQRSPSMEPVEAMGIVGLCVCCARTIELELYRHSRVLHGESGEDWGIVG